ncbi:MAG: hypothetical protein JSV56_00015 [Methanomassiliicoccales archaeon]|nr:MAG: hypothetical protein JSV56_00015 [Methanomassiliicoccales archaeon]
MNGTDKICVFCGKPPTSKNKEHVIPQWLMAHTNVMDNNVRLGFDKHTGVIREFVYKAFTFPACELCNSRFAELESIVKPILLKLLSESPLTNIDLHYLLDWFDKVRVGLWLGFYYLDKNIGNITPNFHIQTRITAHDRMLHIVKVENIGQELSFRGCDTLSFHFTPSCFSMTINNFCFYNISSPFLFARRIGFPYPSKSYLRKDGLADYSIEPAREQIVRPLLLKPFAFSGVGIYQPIFKSLLRKEYSAYCNNDYVKSNSLSFENGIGNIFIHSNGKVIAYPSDPALDWCPSSYYDRISMNPAISIDTLEQQLHLETLMPSTEKLPECDKNWWKDALCETRRYANGLIKTMKNNVKEGIS